MRATAMHSEGCDRQYQPTLILCPSTLIDTWYMECSKYFASVLTLCQWYGSKSSIRNLSHQKILLGSTKRALVEFLDTLDSGDPKTAGVLILTSYSTWHSRSLIESKVGVKDEKGKGKARADYDVPDDGDSGDEDIVENDNAENTEDEEEISLLEYASFFTGRFDRVNCDEAYCF